MNVVFISYSYKSDVIYILEQYIWHFYTIAGNYMGRFVKFKDKLLLEVLASISIFENKVYFESKRGLFIIIGKK